MDQWFNYSYFIIVLCVEQFVNSFNFLLIYIYIYIYKALTNEHETPKIRVKKKKTTSFYTLIAAYIMCPSILFTQGIQG
jgi:uncharacterized membrane-anchored protein